MTAARRALTLVEIILAAGLFLTLVGILTVTLTMLIRRLHRTDEQLSRVEQAVLVREFMLRRLDNAVALYARDDVFEYYLPRRASGPLTFAPGAADTVSWNQLERFRLRVVDHELVEVGPTFTRLLWRLGPGGRCRFDFSAPPLVSVTAYGTDETARPPLAWQRNFEIVFRGQLP